MSLRRDPVSGVSSQVVSFHCRPNDFVAIYYACATLSGAFGGLIAYGVQSDLASQGGRKPWSWLFLIEGVLAVGIGLIIILALPRFPDDLHRREKRHWLFTPEEIDLAYKRYNGKLHF
jgi:MFS family permease